MGVLARSILLTNSALAFLEYGKNIPVHTLIAIDTMHAAYGYMAWRLFDAGELHVNSAVRSQFIAFLLILYWK
jgi:hypothetical protein